MYWILHKVPVKMNQVLPMIKADSWSCIQGRNSFYIPNREQISVLVQTWRFNHSSSQRIEIGSFFQHIRPAPTNKSAKWRRLKINNCPKKTQTSCKPDWDRSLSLELVLSVYQFWVWRLCFCVFFLYVVLICYNLTMSQLLYATHCFLVSGLYCCYWMHWLCLCWQHKHNMLTSQHWQHEVFILL